MKKILLLFVIILLSSKLFLLGLLVPEITPAFYEIINDPPEWMYTSIEKDFSHFEKEKYFDIQRLMSDIKKREDLSNSNCFERYTVIKDEDGKQKVKTFSYIENEDLKWRSWVFTAALQKLLDAAPLPVDLNFIVSFDDFSNYHDLTAPILVQNKEKVNNFVVNIPDTIALLEDTWNQASNSALIHTNWKDKLDMAFFRGATSSGDFSDKNWVDRIRSKIVLLSLEKPSLVDAKFTLLVQGAESNKDMIDFLTSNNLIGENITPEDSINYKYLIDVDGNVNSWARTYWTLASNSAVLKQNDSPFTLWYHRILQPYIHYIPYSSDLSDLKDQLIWARLHQDEAELIGKNGRILMTRELTSDHMYAYLYLTLKKYHTLSMKFDSIKISVSSPSELQVTNIKNISDLDNDLVLQHANNPKTIKTIEWEKDKGLLVLEKSGKFRVYKIGKGRSPALIQSKCKEDIVRYINEY